MTIAACGQWFSLAMTNPCLRCEKTGTVKIKRFGIDKCDCCYGRGIHKVFPNIVGERGKKPFFWT